MAHNRFLEQGALAPTLTATGERVPSEFTKPPHPDLKASVVIPVRGEMQSGNFFNNLQSFARQRGLPNSHAFSMNNFEVMYVVNNTKQDIQNNTKEFQDNQRILSLIRYIQTDPTVHVELPFPLQKWEKAIVDHARYMRLPIQGIDLSSSSHALPEKNITTACWVGQQVAHDRLLSTKSGQEGAILVMDADTRVTSREGIAQIIDQLVNKPDVSVLNMLWDFTPGEGGPGIYEAHGVFRNLKLWGALYDLYDNLYPFWKAIKVRSINPSDFAQETLPTWVNYFSPNDNGETSLARGIRIVSADRARPREDGGGFGYARYMDIHSNKNTLNRDKVSCDLGRHFLSSFGVAKETIPAEPKRQALMLMRILQRNITRQNMPELQDKFTEICTRELRYERRKHHIRRNGLMQIISHTTSEGQPLTEGTRLAGFLNHHEWIPEKIQQIKFSFVKMLEREPMRDEIMEVLTYQFPDVTQSFAKSTYGIANAMLLGIFRFAETLSDEERKVIFQLKAKA